MNNKNNILQNQIAKESIFTALMILMEQKDFKEITITEVTKRAGVSRMAFYRNYVQLEDIITQYLKEYFEYYAKQLGNNPFTNYEGVRLYFSGLRKQEKLITNLIHSNITNLIYVSSIEFFRSFSQNINCERKYSAEETGYHSEFIIGGIYHVLLEWAKNGMKESDENMADFIDHLIV